MLLLEGTNQETTMTMRTERTQMPLIELFRDILDRRHAHTTDGVAQVLGRPARGVRTCAQARAASGAWQP
jgi:hypothetical protein